MKRTLLAALALLGTLTLCPAQDKKPAATPAADPLLEPPGVWLRLWGLRVGPGWK